MDERVTKITDACNNLEANEYKKMKDAIEALKINYSSTVDGIINALKELSDLTNSGYDAMEKATNELESSLNEIEKDDENVTDDDYNAANDAWDKMIDFGDEFEDINEVAEDYIECLEAFKSIWE